MARILVVEDEPAERIRYCAALRDVGHEVYTADDGVEALAKLQLAPELILLDLMTPRVDGYDVLKRLRATPGHETTPVIVISGVATGDWATYLGANRFLRKPLPLSTLMDAVRELLAMSSQS